MNHDYTPKEIADATVQASYQHPELRGLDIPPVKAILDALPKSAPEDHAEWEECTWSDILPTDKRVKAEYISGTVIEGVPDGISDNGVYLVDGKLIPYSTDAKWHHIPYAGPNPAEYPVILVTAADRVTYNQPEPHVWDGEAYSAIDRELSYLMPGQITDWAPGEVVPQKECRQRG